MDLTLVLPIRIETAADEVAVAAMLDSLEADSLSLCQCERAVFLSGKYSRPTRGRLHKMASPGLFFEITSGSINQDSTKLDKWDGWEEVYIDHQKERSDVVQLDTPCIVEKGWLDRIVIEADRTGGVVRQGPATYYPRKLTTT